MKYLILQISLFFCVSMFTFSSISAQEITYLNKYKSPISDLNTYEPVYYNLATIDQGKLVVKTYSMDSVLVSEKHTGYSIDNKELVLYLAEYDKEGNLFHYQKMMGENKVFDQVFYDNKKIKYQKVLLGQEVLEASYFDEQGQPRGEIVEERPAPKGGLQGWNNYLMKNLRYPKDAKRKGEEGVAYLYFKIDEEGRMHDLDLMNPEDISPSLAEEALRVIGSYPYKWTPAKYDGKPVCEEVRLPLRFKIG